MTKEAAFVIGGPGNAGIDEGTDADDKDPSGKDERSSPRVPGSTRPPERGTGIAREFDMIVDFDAEERSETDDDGKMGYAQRMEMGEAMRLSKHPENVPLFTVEGAPLSENVKKDKDDKVKNEVVCLARKIDSGAVTIKNGSFKFRHVVPKT